MKKSGALAVIGAENVFPATSRVLEAENMAWETAQKWIEGHQTLAHPEAETPQQL